jgi:hypothetical protein
MKGGGRAPPALASLGKFFHHGGMYARKRPLPLCVCSLLCGQRRRGEASSERIEWYIKRRGSAFLAVVWFGSSPTLSRQQIVSLSQSSAAEVDCVVFSWAVFAIENLAVGALSSWHNSTNHALPPPSSLFVSPSKAGQEAKQGHYPILQPLWSILLLTMD